MKNWTGRLTYALALALVGLTGCQKDIEMDPLKAAYQERAGQAVGKYANTISRMIGSAKSSRTAVRASVGGWDPFGGNLYGGFATSENIDADTERCAQVMQQIPRVAQYFYARLAILSQCLDVAINYRNAVQTYGYRNMDYGGQYGWDYGLNFARPTTFGQFSQADGQQWNFFAGNGIHRGQIPTGYQVPGYGW
jgi:hypothetical protein